MLAVKLVPGSGAAGAAAKAAAGSGASPWAYAAAICMGAGDGIVTTVVIARLGHLADDAGLFPREASFQFFQVVNVLMSAVTFSYASRLPLATSGAQVWVAAGLAVVGVAAFCFAPMPPKKSSS